MEREKEAKGTMELSEEWICAICLESFQNPVTIDCGHNFCQACLSQCWGDADLSAPCPQCRQIVPRRTFKPNWQLASIIEAAKKLVEEKEATWRKNVCAKHWVPLQLFCKEDEALLCLVCEQSKEHQDHTVVPGEDVAEEYKKQIKAHQKSLEERRNHLENQILSENSKSKLCLKQLEIENKKISSAFDQMQNFLKEKKCFWLEQLDHLENSIKETQKRNVSKLSEEMLHLRTLITEMNGKLLQPANEFLQDIKITLRRSQEKQFDSALYLLPGLEKKLTTFSQKASTLVMAMNKYEDCLECALMKAWSPKQVVDKVNVTLDSETANPFLILSKNLKNVKCGDEEQNLPNISERFDWEPCVLGCERFTSGNAWWEVEVKEEGEMWALGVARDTIRRKRHFIPSPDEGIWAIGKPSGNSFSSVELWAFTSPNPTLLTLRCNPRKILVYLIYEESCVEFFDADSEKSIFTFSSASFSGEAVRPFFWVTPGVWLKC